jgi:hypothetical protein
LIRGAPNLKTSPERPTEEPTTGGTHSPIGVMGPLAEAAVAAAAAIVRRLATAEPGVAVTTDEANAAADGICIAAADGICICIEASICMAWAGAGAGAGALEISRSLEK